MFPNRWILKTPHPRILIGHHRTFSIRSTTSLLKSNQQPYTRQLFKPNLRSFKLRYQIAFSTSHSPTPTPITSNAQLIPLTSPIVAHHLLLVATLVFSIVVVGGLTRLTESGLSITEWNLVSGTIPPLTDEAWEIEFSKYKLTPEYRLLNHMIDIESFKTIYKWEWAHRFLGRLIGLAFLIPLPFFFKNKLIHSQMNKIGLISIGTLIGAQGGLGWYMVKSGLDQIEVDSRDGIPRVSQYRLAAHLAMAFAVYATSLRLAGGILRDWKLGAQGKSLGGVSSVMESVRMLEAKVSTRARKLVTGLTGLVFLTAVSGAFVAGLDAGLVYNTFPLMGENLIPPKSELFLNTISSRNNGRQGWIRNFFENPITVQLDHRILAMTTTFSTIGFLSWVNLNRRLLPPNTLKWARAMGGMIILQVGLGISTLIYIVPTTLAAAHQAGSLVLLSLSIATGLSLRKPSLIAKQLFHSKFIQPVIKPYHK